MHRTIKGLPLLALLMTLAPLNPASAQGYYGYPYNPYNQYAPGATAVDIQPQINQLQAQISSAVSSGRIGQSDGNNLMQGLNQIAAQAAYGTDPYTLSTALSTYSQRINTLIGQADAIRATGNYGYGFGRRNRLGQLQNFWR